MKRINRERMKRVRAVQFGPQAEACRRSSCYACGSPGPCDPHHLKSRATGGKDRDCVPLCRGPYGCHALFHEKGRKRFEEMMGINLDYALAWMRDSAEWKSKHPEAIPSAGHP